MQRICKLLSALRLDGVRYDRHRRTCTVVRERSFENQLFRASGLNLVVAAIVLWNTVYLERAVQSLKAHGRAVDDILLTHLSPLAWEHINLTGDYAWRQSRQVERGKFRPLRPFASP